MISCLQLNAQTPTGAKAKKQKHYTAAAYYFPNYHPYSINTSLYGKGCTKWKDLNVAHCAIGVVHIGNKLGMLSSLFNIQIAKVC